MKRGNRSMNLIDKQKEALLQQFYAERLAPIAKSLRSHGVEFFALQPNPEATTYYLERKDVSDYIFQIDTEDIGQRLRERWIQEGHFELIELVEPLLDLASQLRQHEKISEDVSPYIYAMV
jgi:hypothetical protein